MKRNDVCDDKDNDERIISGIIRKKGSNGLAAISGVFGVQRKCK